MSKQNRELRQFLRSGLKDFIANCHTLSKAQKNYLIEHLNNRFIQNDSAYGVAEELDFKELSPLFANLFAYDNKHYYVYKAISDSNKLGFLSARQYFALKALKHRLSHDDRFNASGRMRQIEEFLQNKGTMASPYKMLKRAFKENPERSKFLAVFFPLEEDKKTTKNEDKLIELCDSMMRTNTNIEIKPATVQECYDVRVSDDYSASGERFATSSCMFGFQVGAFYEAFGVEGRIVYERGKPVGRFLLWNLPDGKQYVDRLYIQSHGYQDALAEIDKQFPNAIKYPALRNGGSEAYRIPMKNKQAFIEKELRVPYIDTFSHLYREGNNYFLCNKPYYESRADIGKYIDTLQNVGESKHFKSCPHCHALGWQGDKDMDASRKDHLLVCTSYQPKQKRIKAMLDLYRAYVSKGGSTDEQTPLFEL